MMNEQNHLRNHRSQTYLRSDHRNLSSDLFGSSSKGENDTMAHSWTLSGNFSSSEDLYLPDRTIRQSDDLSPSPLPLSPGLPKEEIPMTDNAFFTTILPLIMLAICCCLCRSGGPPGEEFHRGHLIRQNAERIWAMEARKAKRKEATPEERLAKIRSGLRTMKVVSKNPSTGRCQLGEPMEGVDESTATNNKTIDSKQSMDTADTLPIEFDNSDDEVLDSSNRTSNSGSAFAEDDNDVCHVCLDGFEAGDIVMFSKNLSCTHVFHEECLLPWLLERRENECPNCRVPLVDEEDDIDETDENKNENTTESTDCDACNHDGNENTDESILDIESGGRKSDHRTTYFIVKGRIVAASNDSNLQDTFECESTDQSTFCGREEDCCAAKTIADKRQFQRIRALSMPSIDEMSQTSQKSLSVPLTLRRVSLSLPTEKSCSRRRTGPLSPSGFCRVSVPPATAQQQEAPRDTLWLDARNRLSGLHAGFYDSHSSSSEDYSDEDEIFRGMEANRANGTKDFSSILR